MAVHDTEGCTLCGACVRRCHFAFFYDGAVVEIDGKPRKHIVYDAERCRGCGLCANSCPSEAIVMESLP